MRNILFLTTLILSCSKPISNNTIIASSGQVIIYTDVFVSANCKVDSVSVFIDNSYQGKIIGTHLPLSEAPQYGDVNSMSQSLKIGAHTYLAKINGCSKNKWEGTFVVDSNTTTKIKLDLSTSKP